MKPTGETGRLVEIFRVPLVIALLSAVGLIAALTGDGWLDVVSWAALSVQPVVIIWAMRRRPSSRQKTS